MAEWKDFQRVEYSVDHWAAQRGVKRAAGTVLLTAGRSDARKAGEMA